MNKTRTIEGELNASDMRITIVASRFNEFIVESLIKASLHCLRRHGAADSDIELVRVPVIPGSSDRPKSWHWGRRYPTHQWESDWRLWRVTWPCIKKLFQDGRAS